MIELKQRWLALLQQEPKLRIRDAAEKLEVSELELLEIQLGAEVVRLRPEAKKMMAALHKLGRVMSLVRNDACVHESKGCFAEYSGGEADVGLFLGEQDLRMFFRHWCHIYALHQNDRHSIQVFDQSGMAIIKIYAQPETDIHQFHGLLKDMQLTRSQAFELIDDEYACRLDNESVEYVLTEACHDNIPTIEFVHNRGAVQIHTDHNVKLVRMGPWFNVLDENFNLHLDTTLITEVWALRRPGDSGIISSIEALDADGNVIIQIFGQRTEGRQERSDWRALVQECVVKRALAAEAAKV